jgi:hypothetical protein
MPSVFYEEHHVIEDVKYLPCISVIMPFDPKMGQKSAIESRLRSAMNKVKNELQENYPDEKAAPVFQKLDSLIQNLNYGTHKKSIAVFVSPLVAKIYYLDMAVKEKIIIDESFEIRDVVYSKKEILKYLVLILGSKRSSIFLGESADFKRIVSDTPNQAGENYGKPAFPHTDACSPSSPGVMFMDYMDYTDDAAMFMFTNGQKSRILATFATGGPRNSFAH